MNYANSRMDVNNLILNFSKSKILLINSTGFNTEKVYLSFDTNWSTSFKTSIVENAKYLGVKLDKNLSFDCHINKVVKKTIKGCTNFR